MRPTSCHACVVQAAPDRPTSAKPILSTADDLAIIEGGDQQVSRSAFLTAWLLRLSSRATDGWWQAWYRHATCDGDIAVRQASYDISAEQERVCAVASL